MKLIVAFLNFTNAPKTIQEQTAFITSTQLGSFLGAFTKPRKATISFVVFVCPSVLPQGTSRPPVDGFS